MGDKRTVALSILLAIHAPGGYIQEMRRFFRLCQIGMGCLLVLAIATGVLARHTPALAAQHPVLHASMHMHAPHGMTGASSQHPDLAAVACPSPTAATHHLMHHHAACCMTGNALSAVDTAVGMLPVGFLWHTRARPMIARTTALPYRRAAPLLRPPKLHTA